MGLFPEELNIPSVADTIRDPIRTVAPLEAIYKKLLDVLDPVQSINAKLSLEISRPERLNEDKKDKLDPILAYPKFGRPMYEALRDISQDLLLPSAQDIPENTIGVLVTNTTFLNSYMVGLNHEFAQELLWRGYPTDQRGTYFRQFWDVSVAVEKERLQKLAQKSLSQIEEEEIREKYRDIKEIHKWKESSLGKNQNDTREKEQF